MAINKVIYDGNTLIDLTDDTVDASTLLVGYTAHDRSGAVINGAFDPSVYVLKAGDTMTGALNFGTTGKISSTELKINDRNILGEFKAHTQYFATEIPANANLKTTAFLNAGRYVCRQTTTVATLSNCPVSTAFNMDVDYPISLFNTAPSTWGYILRTITTLNGEQWVQYVYIDGNGTITWNDWTKLRGATADGNVIQQIETTSSARYSLLMSESGRSTSDATERTRKSYGLTYNPSDGSLRVDRYHTGTTAQFSYLYVGNDTADGTAGAVGGVLRLYGKKSFYASIYDKNNALTAHRAISLQDKEGELPILEDGVLEVGNRNIQMTGVDTGRSMSIRTKAGGIAYLTYFANGNHGIYSSGYESDVTDSSTYTASNKWIIRRNSAGNVYVDEWASIGSASTPVYFNSAGRPVVGNEIVSTSKTAESGGTDLSLVTTGEKYTWNSKTSNTGTVTSVAVSGSKGISISGSPITSSGTITVGVSTSSGTATRNTTNTSGGEIKYVKYGRVVTIYTSSMFTISSSGAAANKVYFTGLPKPSANTCFTGYGPSNKAITFGINTDGALISMFNTPPTGGCYVGTTYIAAS